MKRLILILALACNSQAAITLIAHTIVSGASTSTSNPAIVTTGANFLIIHLSWAANAITISDSKMNSWTALTQSPANNGASRLFYAENATVGTGHTFTFTGTNVFASMDIAAYAGVKLSSSFEQECNNTGNIAATNINACSIGSITPSVVNMLIVTGFHVEVDLGPYTIDTGFTITDQAALVGGVSYGSALAYLIETSIVNVNPNWAGSGTPGRLASTTASFLPSTLSTVRHLVLQ